MLVSRQKPTGTSALHLWGTVLYHGGAQDIHQEAMHTRPTVSQTDSLIRDRLTTAVDSRCTNRKLHVQASPAECLHTATGESSLLNLLRMPDLSNWRASSNTCSEH